MGFALRFLVLWGVMTAALWGLSTTPLYREASIGVRALVGGIVGGMGIFILGHYLGLWRRARSWGEKRRSG